MPNDSLATYLNDHLAGSVVALQLLDHLTEDGAGTTETSLNSTDRHRPLEPEPRLAGATLALPLLGLAHRFRLDVAAKEILGLPKRAIEIEG